MMVSLGICRRYRRPRSMSAIYGSQRCIVLPESWLPWLTRIYFGAAGLAAVLTVVTVVVGVMQSQLSDQISNRKDREFDSFKLTSNETTSSLRTEAAKANERAEADRLARVKIEQKLAPRTITDKQAQDFIIVLKQFTGSSIDVIFCGDTPENGQLVDRIYPLFQLSGWTTKIWAAMSGGGLTVTGIVIQNSDDASLESKITAEAIVSNLLSADLAVVWGTPFHGTNIPFVLTGDIWDKNSVSPIRMLIGTKP